MNQNNCTCSIIPFTPECSYCNNKLYRWIETRDLQIKKIKEKNILENKCKCSYFLNLCFVTCEPCEIEYNNWYQNLYLHENSQNTKQ